MSNHLAHNSDSCLLILAGFALVARVQVKADSKLKGPNFEPSATARRFLDPRVSFLGPCQVFHVTNSAQGNGQKAARQTEFG